MKKVIAWVKANLLVVVFSAIIVIALPAGYVGASMFGAGMKKERAEKVNRRLTELKGSVFKYSVPPIMPGGSGIDESAPPNRELTTFFADQRARTEKAAQEVVKAALDFNQGKGAEAAKVGRKPHVPLVDGLFPRPAAGASTTELTNRFVERLVDRKEGVYQKMLREVLNAGEPLNPEALTKKLESAKAGQLQQVKEAGNAVDKDLQARLEQELLDLRRREHLARAADISIYATMDALPIEGGPVVEGSTIPKQIPERPPAVSRAFQWQMDYWLIRDLFTAIRVANTSSGGGLSPVSASVVKRLERITIKEPFATPVFAAGDSSSPETQTIAPATTLDQLAGLVPSDLAQSITGRKSTPQNPLYDVRLVQVQMVVSSARMKELFNAFAKTNFMTILDIDLKEVDVRGDLDRGFYYGPEGVLRANIVVETIWLRGWTQELFPSGVKKRLGMTLAEGEKSDDAEMASGSAGFGGSGPIDPFAPQEGGGDTPPPMSSKGPGRGR